MYENTKNTLAKKAVSKVEFLNERPAEYFIAAMLAGAYVGIAYFFAMTVADAVKEASDSSLYKVALGVSFTMALNLIIFAGSELFTGTNMLMSVGGLRIKHPNKQYNRLM